MLDSKEAREIVSDLIYEAHQSNQLVLDVTLDTIFYDPENTTVCSTGTAFNKTCPKLSFDLCGNASCSKFNTPLSRGTSEQGEPGVGYIQRCKKCNELVG